MFLDRLLAREDQRTGAVVQRARIRSRHRAVLLEGGAQRRHLLLVELFEFLILAHDRALALYKDSRLAVRSQYWMLAVMVGFTSLALWLLARAGA